MSSSDLPGVYLAGPLGFAESTDLWRTKVLRPALSAAGLRPSDPWHDPDGSISGELRAAASIAKDADRLAALRAINHRIGETNVSAIRTADGMFAVLDGADVDSGTAAEVGFAAALGKPVVGVRTDFRLTGDNAGATVNLQVEYFIQESGGEVFQGVEAALSALKDLLGGEARSPLPRHG